MTTLVDRVRRLRPSAAEVPAWSVAPGARVARPDLVVALAASDRLRVGLADQWRQRSVDPVAPHVTGADVLLVELADGLVPGFGRPDEPRVAGLIDAAARSQVPITLWITSGRPPSGLDATAAQARLLQAADVVLVADLVEAWQRVVPEARLLPPAAPARRAPRRTSQPHALVVSRGASDERAAGPVAAVLGPGLAPIADRVEVLLVEHDLPARGVLPAAIAERARPAGHLEAAAALREAAVVVDGPRRSPGDSWTALEAAAAGTPVVSLDGRSAASLRAEVVARLHHEELRDRDAQRQRRAVLAADTFDHRARALLGEPAPAPPSVSAVVPTNRPHEIDTVLANLGRQSHPDTELVLVLHGIDVPSAELRARADEHGVRDLQVVRAPGHLTLGACMNLGVDASGGDLVAKMDDDNHYGVHYLSDLAAELRAQGAGIAGKWGHYVWLRSSGAVVLRYPDAEHTWARRIQGGSMLFEGDVVRDLRFGDLPRAVDSDILDRAIGAGVRIWSADRFNFVSVRGEDRTAHTWTVEDASFLTASGRLAFYGDPRPHVEV